MKNIIDSLIQFPLYQDDGIPFYRLKEHQIHAIKSLNDKIKNQIYKQVENKCLCSNLKTEDDIIIAQKDMAGISVNNILCSKCGLIRSEKIFDNKSWQSFYENEYNTIYYNSEGPSEEFFQSQVERGEGFLTLIKKLNLLSSIHTVFEVGCSAGGGLYPFHRSNKLVSGSDYSVEFINYGKTKGLDLYSGFINSETTKDGTQDLVILSHVMEHFVNLIDDVKNVIDKIKSGGYLLVEVPGIFADKPYAFYPIWHLQRAHIYNFFYCEYLKVFFSSLGLSVIYGDERCTFVLQKPLDYRRRDQVPVIYSNELSKYPEIIEAYIKRSYFRMDYFKFLNVVRVKQVMWRSLRAVGLLGMVKVLLNK